MKKLLTILLFIIAVNSFGQGNWTLSGAKNRWANGMGFGSKDTASFTNGSDTNLLVLFNGSLCYRHLLTDHWLVLVDAAGGTGFVFTDLSNANTNATLNLSSGGLVKVDSIKSNTALGISTPLYLANNNAIMLRKAGNGTAANFAVMTTADSISINAAANGLTEKSTTITNSGNINTTTLNVSGNINTSSEVNSGNLTVSGTINNSNLSASNALITDAGKNIKSSGTTATELSYLSGATSNIQAQITAIGNTEYITKLSNTTLTSVSPFINLSVTGNLTGATIGGTLTTQAQTNITSLGTVSNLTIAGNLVANALIGNGNAITGTAYGLTAGTATTAIAVNSVNVSGNTNYYLALFGSPTSTSQAVDVATPFSVNPVNGTINATTFAGNATTATTATSAGIVTTAAQPNITSVGTLTSLTVTNSITAATFYGTLHGTADAVANPLFLGANLVYTSGSSYNGSNTRTINTIQDILTTSNVMFATLSATILTTAQPNITSLGTLTGLIVNGNITSTATIIGSVISATSSIFTNSLSVTGTASVFDSLTFSKSPLRSIIRHDGVNFSINNKDNGKVYIGTHNLVAAIFDENQNTILSGQLSLPTYATIIKNGSNISGSASFYQQNVSGGTYANNMRMGSLGQYNFDQYLNDQWNTSGWFDSTRRFHTAFDALINGSMSVGGDVNITGSISASNITAPTSASFTVTMTAGTSGTITLNNNTMRYIKNGNMVTITGYIDVASVSTPLGSLTINGLPFTSGNNLYNYAAINIRANLLSSTATTSIVGYIAQNSNSMVLEKYTVGSTNNLAGDVTSGSQFIISVTYFTN